MIKEKGGAWEEGTGYANTAYNLLNVCVQCAYASIYGLPHSFLLNMACRVEDGVGFFYTKLQPTTLNVMRQCTHICTAYHSALSKKLRRKFATQSYSFISRMHLIAAVVMLAG